MNCSRPCGKRVVSGCLAKRRKGPSVRPVFLHGAAAHPPERDKAKDQVKSFLVSRVGLHFASKQGKDLLHMFKGIQSFIPPVKSTVLPHVLSTCCTASSVVPPTPHLSSLLHHILQILSFFDVAASIQNGRARRRSSVLCFVSVDATGCDRFL